MATVDLVERVARDLEEQILAGRLLPGDRLPPERELGVQLNVSRSVVREAIKRLQSLGLVSSIQGSGTRVERASGKPVQVGYERLMRHGRASLQDLAVVRLPLEKTIVALAAVSRSDEHLARLDEAQRILGNSQASLEDRIQADLRFHSILAEATGNSVFEMVLQPMQALLIESRRRTLNAYGAALAYEHHARILDAVRRRDPAAAVAAMSEHLEVNTEHLRSLSQQDIPVPE